MQSDVSVSAEQNLKHRIHHLDIHLITVSSPITVGSLCLQAAAVPFRCLLGIIGIIELQ